MIGKWKSHENFCSLIGVCLLNTNYLLLLKTELNVAVVSRVKYNKLLYEKWYKFDTLLYLYLPKLKQSPWLRPIPVCFSKSFKLDNKLLLQHVYGYVLFVFIFPQLQRKFCWLPYQALLVWCARREAGPETQQGRPVKKFLRVSTNCPVCSLY